LGVKTYQFIEPTMVTFTSRGRQKMVYNFKIGHVQVQILGKKDFCEFL